MNIIPLVIRLNKWFCNTAGGERRPVIFDIDQTYPTLRSLDEAYPGIRRELLQVMQEGHEQLPSYHQLDAAQKRVSDSTPNSWKVYYLWAMGKRAEPNATQCPVTSDALAGIPNLFQAFFSILDPGKSVPAHDGPYYGYLRYHLGLRVPTERPPQIRIRDEMYTWKEGESILFDDSWNHEVINNSSELRAVLIVDVLRPMPLIQTLANRGFAFAARYFYGRKVLARVRDYADAVK